MNKPLPFFNWSLKKAKDTEPDSFAKARIGIIYTIVLFSLVKAAIVISMGAAFGQWKQVGRAVVVCLFYISLFKILLYKPSRITLLAHIMISLGVLIVWTNIFIYAQKINLVTIQFVFMVILSSFYILGNRLGILYSVIAVLPVMLFLAIKGNMTLYFTGSAEEFASPGYEIIVVLNFISIVIAHYLFFKAFRVNISEKEKLNEELQQSIIEATQLAASKSNFLSTMSHELRTPLNAVVGITELLLAEKPEERQLENLKVLQFSAIDLLALINNVLDFNKIDSDKAVLEPVPFGLAEFIRNICAVLRIKADDKQLHLVADIDAGLENMNVISDPTRLAQVMYNLIGNAIKFTGKGSVTVKLEVTRQWERGVEVLFSVTDTGIGIQPDKHETIFELFSQAERHTVRKYGGTGLGLAIVKKVLALFNSTIQLQSSPGKGTNFYFPISFVTEATTTKTVPLGPGDDQNFGHLKILVAEDNSVNRLVIRKQLAALNIKPVIVENGEQAYEEFLAHSFDAILIDLHMPVLNGYETIKRVRATKDSAKARMYMVAFTASSIEDEKIAEAGFDDFIYKPVNMGVLQDKLEKISMHIACRAASNN